MAEIVRGHPPANFWQNFFDSASNSGSIDTNLMGVGKSFEQKPLKNEFYGGWHCEIKYPSSPKFRAPKN